MLDIVMGTSGGAVTALLMAALHPGCVRAVIADSFEERFPEELVQTHLIENRAQRTPGQVAFWEAAHGADWEQVVGADTEMLARLARRGGECFGGCLGQVRGPVLLTASREDELVPDAARQMCSLAAQIADCRIYVNHSGGHPLMWSRPRDFRAIVDRFLVWWSSRVQMGVLILGVGAAAIRLVMRYAAKRFGGLSRRLVGQGIPEQSPRKAGVLWALILVAILYVALLRLLPTLTGSAVWDGGIGVALGLFICAHPAANAINILFFERQTLQQVPSDRPLMRWLALNLMVLLVGWMMVFVGIRRLVERVT